MMTAELLKASILQLAMQGKLVEQRPEEGTGEELYQEIQAEKKRLIKEGKIKKQKPLMEITEDEIPFNIPASWKWVRWGDLSESIQYGYNAPALDVGSIKMVRISDIQENIVNWESVPFCFIAEKDISTYLLAPNDILFARTGGTVGKSYLVKEVPEKAVYAGYLIRTRYSSLLCPEFLKLFMESDLYWNQLHEGTIATAQPNCNGKTLSKMIVPLPPLAEQKRIVAKIEELMPFIDQYETASTKLTTLNTAFPDQMKKSILQQAVMGKLVPQDPTDEPASVLLGKIRKEKERLIKEGKIKKQKPLPEITEDEIPFDIPESWEWVRLFEILLSFNTGPFGSMLHKEDYASQGVPLINPANIIDGVIVHNEKAIVKYSEIDRLSRYRLKENDIVIGRRGEMGRCAVVRKSQDGWLCGTGCFFMSVSDYVDREYVRLLISGTYGSAYLEENAIGTTMKNLNQTIITIMPVPIPPLVEQHRIVARLNELLPLCDTLAGE